MSPIEKAELNKRRLEAAKRRAASRGAELDNGFRDGVRLRASTMPNARAVASKKACRQDARAS